MRARHAHAYAHTQTLAHMHAVRLPCSAAAASAPACIPGDALDADTASAAELLAALEEGGGVQGDDKWKRLGIDFDNWNWWQKEAGAQTKRSTSMRGLDDPQVQGTSMHV